jgi:hypothetical protein
MPPVGDSIEPGILCLSPARIHVFRTTYLQILFGLEEIFHRRDAESAEDSRRIRNSGTRRVSLKWSVALSAFSASLR